MYYVRQANKYGAKKTEFNGRVYDSKGEAGLAQELLLLQRAGEIIKIEPQVTFNLYGKNGGRVCTHRVDFLVALPNQSKQVYEYKGLATAVWRIKLKLFEDNYPDITYNVITARERYQ